MGKDVDRGLIFALRGFVGILVTAHYQLLKLMGFHEP
jgi:hypothetical protein